MAKILDFLEYVAANPRIKKKNEIESGSRIEFIIKEFSEKMVLNPRDAIWSFDRTVEELERFEPQGHNSSKPRILRAIEKTYRFLPDNLKVEALSKVCVMLDDTPISEARETVSYLEDGIFVADIVYNKELVPDLQRLKNILQGSKDFFGFLNSAQSQSNNLWIAYSVMKKNHDKHGIRNEYYNRHYDEVSNALEVISALTYKNLANKERLRLVRSNYVQLFDERLYTEIERRIAEGKWVNLKEALSNPKSPSA